MFSLLSVLAYVLAQAPSSDRWREERNCGPNALYLLVRAKGIPVDYERLRTLIAVGPKGASLFDLKKAAQDLGLHATVFKASPRALMDCDLPLVAHMEFNTFGHYVVVTAANDQQVQVLDGGTALYQVMSWERFARNWSGYVFVLEKDSHLFPRNLVFLASISTLLALVFFKKSRSWVSTTVLTGIRLPKRLCASLTKGLACAVSLAFVGHGVAAGGAQTLDLPAEVQEALNRNAREFIPSTITWKESWTTLLPKRELDDIAYGKWKLVRGFFDRKMEFTVIMQDAKRYASQHEIGKAGAHEFAVASDLIYLRSPDGGGIIATERYSRERLPGVLFANTYFELPIPAQLAQPYKLRPAAAKKL